MDSREQLKLFYNQTFERSIDNNNHGGKNYRILRQQLTNYVHELTRIPFIEFINYIKECGIERRVEVSDTTQFSSFSACEIEMCDALILANNPGCNYLEIGRFFPNIIFAKTEAAYKRFGERHIKASTQLGLTFEYKNYWYLSCLGYIYPKLKESDRKRLIARTITRNRLYQQMLIDILDHDINPVVYMDMLPERLLRKSIRCACVFLSFCLEECKKEKIKTHNIVCSYENIKKATTVELPQKPTKDLTGFDYRSLSNEEINDLVMRYRTGDTKAYDLLVKGNMKLIMAIAQTYIHKGVELEDLIQEGTIGFVIALNHYNTNANVSLSKYASWWIRQAIQYALVSYPLMIKIPSNAVNSQRLIRRFVEKYEQEHGILPSDALIEIDEYIDFKRIALLNSLPDNLKDITILSDDLDIYESSFNPIDSFDDADYNSFYLNRLLEYLPSREEDIVRLFFGLGVEPKDLDSIGEKYNLTRERIRQLLVRAVRHMRTIATDKEMRDAIELPKTLSHIVITKDNTPLSEILKNDQVKQKRMTPERIAFLKDLYGTDIENEKNAVTQSKPQKHNTHVIQETKQKEPTRTVRSSNPKTAKIGNRIFRNCD